MREPATTDGGGSNGLRIALRVLASGSGGNCAVLRIECAGESVTALLDAGLSGRRTRALLETIGLTLADIDAAIITHLDADHFNAGWIGKLPAHAVFIMHRRHRGRAERAGALRRRTILCDDTFDLIESLPVKGRSRALPTCAVQVTPCLLSHDDLGVAAFRFDIQGAARAGSLGWATDVGRVTDRLIDLMQGVNVLGIESNYCPHLQMASARPMYLKRRIMGGAGHLSNQESAEAVGHMKPRDGVVLLHLSEECNTPERALEAHAAHGMASVVTSQREATKWVDVPARTAVQIPTATQSMLFAS